MEGRLVLLRLHEMVRGPEHRQPFLVIAQLHRLLGIRKLHHLQHATSAIQAVIAIQALAANINRCRAARNADELFPRAACDEVASLPLMQANDKAADGTVRQCCQTASGAAAEAHSERWKGLYSVDVQIAVGCRF